MTAPQPTTRPGSSKWVTGYLQKSRIEKNHRQPRHPQAAVPITVSLNIDGSARWP
jgi:hypothetical protein